MTLALLGGKPTVAEPLPVWPRSSELEARLLNETLESGVWWRMTGSQVAKFEQEFARRHGMPYGLAVTNGTHALELALRSLQIGSGDEVIIPSMTFIATATAVFNVGARPVAVDVCPDTWCISAGAIKSAITTATRAVIPVHFAGHIAAMDEVQQICQKNRLAVIEDAAHAHGAHWHSQPAGSFGVVSAFSFQNYKLMTAGEGGILLSSDETVYRRAILGANCGRAPGDTQYEHSILGSNYRMCEFQGAVLNAQLTRLEDLAAEREVVGTYLDSLLQEIDGIRPQRRSPSVTRHARYMQVFCYDRRAFSGVSRDLFVRALVAEGVPAYRMYPRVQDTTFYAGALTAVGGNPKEMPECPTSKNLAEEGVWLHHRILLGGQGLADRVAGAITKIKASAAQLLAAGIHTGEQLA